MLINEDNSRGCEEEHDNDEDRNHGPGEFNLIAPVDMRRVLCGVYVCRPMPIPEECEEQQPTHYKNNVSDMPNTRSENL